MHRQIFFSCVIGFLPPMVLAENSPTNPCGGETALLSILDRPSAGDSACVTPNSTQLTEMGYQYQKLFPLGYGQNFPQAVLRFGLPHDTEFVAVLPNYNVNSVQPRSGYNATTIGFKHEILYTEKWVLTIENLMTPASGSQAFGAQGFGDALNGIFSYNLTDTWSVSAMFGINTQTLPIAQGGRRFNSFYPDLVIEWTKGNREWYGEVYGQTKTAPNQNLGLNMDAGVIYLLTKNFSLDLEIGRRLQGTLGGFETYVGMGLGFYFNNAEKKGKVS